MGNHDVAECKLWNEYYILKMVGGRSLMDEVNHVKMVVSLLYYYFVVHAYLLLHDDAVIMLYNYFWIKRFLNFFFIYCRLLK